MLFVFVLVFRSFLQPSFAEYTSSVIIVMYDALFLVPTKLILVATLLKLIQNYRNHYDSVAIFAGMENSILMVSFRYQRRRKSYTNPR